MQSQTSEWVGWMEKTCDDECRGERKEANRGIQERDEVAEGACGASSWSRCDGVLMRAAASKYYHSKFHPQQVHRASVAVGMAAPPAANKVG